MIKTVLADINTTLQDLYKIHVPPLYVRINNENLFEVAGTKETIQGKQKVNGFYFGSIIPKPKDIRLYYFPIYTHPVKFQWISDNLRKCMKGKSCFHFRQLSEELENEIEKMIHQGIQIYTQEKLI